MFEQRQNTGNIMDNLKDWTGFALMCDAYLGYDWLKKINVSSHFRPSFKPC